MEYILIIILKRRSLLKECEIEPFVSHYHFGEDESPLIAPFQSEIAPFASHYHFGEDESPLDCTPLFEFSNPSKPKSQNIRN